MKKYVFSFISFMDNIMTSKIIQSEKDMLEVAIDELNLCGYDVEEVYDIEGLKRFAFDCDSMFEIIEI